MHSIHHTRKQISIFTAALAAALACTPKAPPPPPKPPSATLPPSGTCPGAVPLQNIQVTLSLGESSSPDIVWDGRMFRIAWWDKRSTKPEIYTVGIDREGFEVESAAKIVTNGWSLEPRLSFDGVETHLVWSEAPRVVSTRLGNGAPDVVAITENGAQADSAGWGGAAWVAGGLLYFRSDAMTDRETGAPLPGKVVANGGIESPALVFAGTYYALLWSESVPGGRRIVLQRLSPIGEPLGPPMQVSQGGGSPRSPQAAWTGNGFFAAWSAAEPERPGRNSNRIYIALIPEVGDTPVFSKAVDLYSNAQQVAVVSSGDEYAVSWSADTESRSCAVHFQRFDRLGDPVGRLVTLTDDSPPTCSPPRLAWTGDGYGATWHDDRGQRESEIYFTFIACGDEELPSSAPPPQSAPSSEPDDSNTLPTLKEVL